MLDRDKYNREKQQFFQYLNSIVGGFTVSITLACVGTDSPLQWLTLSSPFIMVSIFVASNAMPESYRRLLRHGLRDPKAKELAKHLGDEDFGFIQMILQAMPYVVGSIFYISVYGYFLFK